MIIVSQDKDITLNFDNTEAIAILNPLENNLENNEGMFKVCAITPSDNEYTLGKYATEERAKEVLQEIIKNFSFTELRDTPEKLKLIMEITKLGRYQMPKE